MKSKNERYRSLRIVAGILIAAAIFLDLTTVREPAVEPGTFRLEEEFTAFSAPEAATNVAIVPSSYNTLANPAARTSSLSYDQIEDMVRKAIELQGGLEDVILDKNSDGKIEVMLKPNIVEKNTPSGWGTNTDARVVKAAIKVIADHTPAAKIYVAEGCPRAGYDDPTSTTSSWEASGYRALLTDDHLNGIDFELFNLNQPFEDLVEVDLGSNGTAAPHNNTFMVHKKEREVDVFISVPVLKIHGTGITCALKNQIGTAPGAWYGYNKCGGTQYCNGLVHQVQQRCWTTEEIVDLCQAAGIDFAIVDAIMCLEREKTYKGDNQVRFNTIIAGRDPVAVDHVCAKLMCLNPDDIAHVTLAEKVGIGTNDPEFINVVGSSVNDVKKKVIKSTGLDGEYGQGNRTWLLSKAFAGEDISVGFIENEAGYIPEPSKDNWSAPTYFFDDRIDLTSYYNGEKGIISYAFTYFYSPAAKEAELWIGNYEDIIVYINGSEVYSYSGTRTFSDSEIYKDKERISILEGQNTLLVKTKHRVYDNEFSINICDLASAEQYGGNRVAGLKFYTESSVGNPEILKRTNQGLLLNMSPNPVKDRAIIKYNLPYDTETTIRVFDLKGRLIETVLDEFAPSGQNEIQWNADRLNPGVYVCTIEAGGYGESIRLIKK